MTDQFPSLQARFPEVKSNGLFIFKICTITCLRKIFKMALLYKLYVIYNSYLNRITAIKEIIYVLRTRNSVGCNKTKMWEMEYNLY